MKQEQIRIANEDEFNRHKKQAAMVKERDLLSVLERINQRQQAAEERVNSQDKAYKEQWALYHAEEELKQREREKKKQREYRKLQLKKEAVVGKMLKN